MLALHELVPIGIKNKIKPKFHLRASTLNERTSLHTSVCWGGGGLNSIRSGSVPRAITAISINAPTRPALSGHPQQVFDSSPATKHPIRDGTKTKINRDQYINENKALWFSVFGCLQCGKRGNQCSQAYYLNADYQRPHCGKHKRAAEAVLALG